MTKDKKKSNRGKDRDGGATTTPDVDKKQDLIGEKVALASYLRTGNSFLRKIIE